MLKHQGLSPIAISPTIYLAKLSLFVLKQDKVIIDNDKMLIFIPDCIIDNDKMLIFIPD